MIRHSFVIVCALFIIALTARLQSRANPQRPAPSVPATDPGSRIPDPVQASYSDQTTAWAREALKTWAGVSPVARELGLEGSGGSQ